MVKKQRASSMRTFYIALVAVAVAGAGLIAWSATRPKSGSRIVDASVPVGSAEAWLYGNPDAPVEIVEFSDYECPACANFATITAPDVRQRIIDAGLANLRYYDFPLPQHGNSVEASLAAACAGDQGRYWEMHDRIFLGQPDWASERNPKGVFADYVRNLDLNVDQWEQCYDQRRHEPRILANKAYGERRGITSTPTFIIGRRMVPGSLSYDRLKAYVDSALADARTAEASMPSAPDTGTPAETTGR